MAGSFRKRSPVTLGAAVLGVVCRGVEPPRPEASRFLAHEPRINYLARGSAARPSGRGDRQRPAVASGHVAATFVLASPRFRRGAGGGGGPGGPAGGVGALGHASGQPCRST